MLYRLLTPVLVLLLLGCESKEYKKSSNSNIQVVSELNKGNNEVVISELKDKQQLSDRERYYLASAYSAQGNVDVFSLYSVLELQLFRKNALEWSDLSKDKNPYLRFMEKQEGVNLEARQKAREERWKKYEDRIIAQHNLRMTKPTIEDLNKDQGYSSDGDFTKEDYEATDKVLSEKYAEIMKLPQDVDSRRSSWDELAEKYYYGSGDEHLNWKTMELYNYYGDQVFFVTTRDRYLHPENNGNLFGNVGWEMLYMNVLWNTYEAIPVIKQMPTLTSDHQALITKALNEFKLLKDSAEFKKVAVKNMAVLVGVSLLSIYKESFDFEEVQDAQDLMCSFTPDSLLKNYGLIRERLLFLVDLLQDSGEIKQAEQYRQQVEAFKNSMPEELTEEQKDRYLSDVDTFKVRSCFSN